MFNFNIEELARRRKTFGDTTISPQGPWRDGQLDMVDRAIAHAKATIDLDRFLAGTIANDRLDLIEQIWPLSERFPAWPFASA